MGAGKRKIWLYRSCYRWVFPCRCPWLVWHTRTFCSSPCLLSFTNPTQFVIHSHRTVCITTCDEMESHYVEYNSDRRIASDLIYCLLLSADSVLTGHCPLVVRLGLAIGETDKSGPSSPNNQPNLNHIFYFGFDKYAFVMCILGTPVGLRDPIPKFNSVSPEYFIFRAVQLENSVDSSLNCIALAESISTCLLVMIRTH
jgi:hypothetical protein